MDPPLEQGLVDAPVGEGGGDDPSGHQEEHAADPQPVGEEPGEQRADAPAHHPGDRRHEADGGASEGLGGHRGHVAHRRRLQGGGGVGLTHSTLKETPERQERRMRV